MIDKFNELRIVIAKSKDAKLIMDLYEENIDILHSTKVTLDEWVNMLCENDPDEQNFLVFDTKDVVGWIKINGLLNEDIAYLSMLVIGKKYQNNGIGGYALKFTENFVKERGFAKLGIHTTKDNIIAQKFYCNHSYIPIETNVDIYFTKNLI